MKLIKILLWPLGLLYGAVAAARNLLYDTGLLKSTRFRVPVIVVGNLAVGGTGKTPHVEYIVTLLRRQFSLAVLSRGYGRKTRGFLEADASATADTLGDEPFMYHRRFPDITVAVGEKRVPAVNRLLQLHPALRVFVLDDAFQHRSIQGGLNILLTEYNHLYTNDWPMPAGRLREFASGSRRADVIVVTKCPEDLSFQEAEKIKRRLLRRENQRVFFSVFRYGKLYSLNGALPPPVSGAVVVTGIARPAPMLSHLEQSIPSLHHLRFPDHHDFSVHDLETIARVCREKNLPLVTTEKDAVRLYTPSHATVFGEIPVWVLPVRVEVMFDAPAFDRLLLRYAGENELPHGNWPI